VNLPAPPSAAAAPPAAGYDVEALRREEFPWAARTAYLNHASTGPLPASARRRLAAYQERRAEPHRLTPDDLFPVLEAARAAAARLVNADPAEIALAPNTSFGLNLAALALPLPPGSVILASDREFPALVYPFRHRARHGDVRFELLPVTAAGWPDEAALVARLDDPAVRCVAVSLTQFANGYTVDLARLSRETRRRGIWLVVDAIQACGQVPVDLRATPVDLLACGAQKWLLSPWGTGFLWVRPDLVPVLEPPWAGWMAFEGTEDFTRLCAYDPRLRRDARRFEMVTLAFHDFVGMAAAVDLLAGLGPGSVAAHLREIRRPVVEWAARRDVAVTSPLDARGSGILCVAPPAPERAFAALEAAGVAASLREGAIRLSPHAYNTVDEMARVAEVLERAR
jgi:selenocysteine lyase/cysteine desulfurase